MAKNYRKRKPKMRSFENLVKATKPGQSLGFRLDKMRKALKPAKTVQVSTEVVET